MTMPCLDRRPADSRRSRPMAMAGMAVAPKAIWTIIGHRRRMGQATRPVMSPIKSRCGASAMHGNGRSGRSHLCFSQCMPRWFIKTIDTGKCKHYFRIAPPMLIIVNTYDFSLSVAQKLRGGRPIAPRGLTLRAKRPYATARSTVCQRDGVVCHGTGIKRAVRHPLLGWRTACHGCRRASRPAACDTCGGVISGRRT